MKVKTFKVLPLMLLSSTALANTPAAPAVEAQPTAVVAPNAVVSQTPAQIPAPVSTPEVAQAAPATDPLLPQLSLSEQMARAAAQSAEMTAEQVEQDRLEQERKREEARKLAEAENRVRQEVGNNTLQLASTTAKIYLDNNFSAVWNDKNAARTFLKEYAVFAASGVSAKAPKALQQILATKEGLALDILLTDSFLDYLYYNKGVAKNANQWLYNLGSYSSKAPSADHISAWVRAVNNGDAGQYVANLVPRNHIYQETVQKLFSMSPNGTAGSSKKAKSKKTKNGAAEETAAAPTGSATFAKLALNAQRLRIIPSFNNGIFVNIPSYQLYYFRDGQLALQSKVIVGRDDRRTPVMYSKLSNVVVNPPWNVPTSILTKDIVPKLARDPGYAERAGFEIIDGSGNKINARSINWSQYVNSKSLPFRLRQKAGDDSALGRYKFNMPSSDAIYLHDTPNRGLFGKDHRALSSGCVRVAKSDELASILLKEAGWSAERKQSVLDSKKTTSANIRSDNPVYLYYVTAWVEGGRVYTLPDIYSFDTNIPRSQINWAAVKSVI